MGTSVDIYNGGVFFVRIHVSRFDEAVIQIGYTVCGFDRTGFDNRHFVAVERIGCCEQVDVLSRLSIDDVNFSGNGGSRVTVNHITA